MITTSINYPSYLPWPQRDGYGINPVSPFRRTEMSNGRAIQRRWFSSVPSMVSVTWIFNSDAEAALFEHFFKKDIKDGAEWFNCPLKTPLGNKLYICRFTRMYSDLVPVGVCAWSASAELEIFERPILADEMAQFPEYILNADILDIAMNEKWSLNNIPSSPPWPSYAAIDLNFVGADSLDGRINHSRTSIASYFGSDGLIKYAPVNTPVFDFDPVTRLSRGLRSESASTNKWTYSEALNSGGKVVCTVTDNAFLSPDGSLTASSVISTGGAYARVNRTIAVSAGVTHCTFSFFVAPNTVRFGHATIETTGRAGRVYFDVNGAGVIAPIGVGIVRSSITKLFIGYYLVEITAETPTAGAYTVFAGPTTTFGNVNSVAGDSLIMWGFQFEERSARSSYNKTLASQFTRASDFIGMSGPSFTGIFNNTEGAIYVGAEGVQSIGNNDGINTLFSLNSGSLNNRISATLPRLGVAGNAEVVNSGSAGASWSYTVLSGENKIGISYKAGDSQFSSNGNQGSINNSASIPDIDRLSLCGNGAQTWNGWLKSLVYVQRREAGDIMKNRTAL